MARRRKKDSGDAIIEALVYLCLGIFVSILSGIAHLITASGNSTPARSGGNRLSARDREREYQKTLDTHLDGLREDADDEVSEG